MAIGGGVFALFVVTLCQCPALTPPIGFAGWFVCLFGLLSKGIKLPFGFGR